jgi:hypothetical protein
MTGQKPIACMLEGGRLVPASGGGPVLSLVAGRVVMTTQGPTSGATQTSATMEPTTPPRQAQSDPNAKKDDAIMEGVHAIQVAVQSWAVVHGDLYPAVDTVVPGGAFAGYVRHWPQNPVTAKLMAPGSGAGDYTYEQLSGGGAFRLTGYGVDGSPIITVP